MDTIFRIVYSFRTYIDYPIPLGMGLSGTPLNESLICLHEILPKFKKENKNNFHSYHAYIVQSEKR